MAGLIDYAGMFPPAALDLKEAVANYQSYRAGEFHWILGRFVVAAARRAEIPPDIPVTLLAPKAEPLPGADSIEVKTSLPQQIVPVPGTTVYYEISAANDPDDLVKLIAGVGGRAKVRCGGDIVPTAAQLARFIQTCARHNVAFKATAGLHHAIPGFLNLFTAAVFPDRAETILEARDLQALPHTSPDQIRHMRKTLGISFGSCSFEEPIQDLKALGLL
jgi:hypothetical protein